jgi:HEAT repeat protein
MWIAAVAGLVVAAIVLAGCGTSKVAQAEQRGDLQSLVLALKDEDADVRGEAAAALGELGDPTAVPMLIRTLDDQEAEVRLSAIQALGELGDAQAVPDLIEVLASSRSIGGELRADEQEAAANVLGQLGDVRAVKPLVRYAAENQEAALAAIVQIGRPAVDPLAEVLQGRSRAARRVAAEALGEIGGPRAAEALVASIATSYTAVSEALLTIGEPAVEPLIEALAAKNAVVRSTAAEILGQLKDRRATAGLKAALADPERQVAEAASGALAELYRRDVAKLLPLLRSSDTVQIYHGLIALGRKSTVDELIAALETYGDEAMAEDYLNCGADRLEAAATSWANSHGYYVTTLPTFGVGAAETWGSKG